MTLIDSHCHLDFPDFASDLDAVVERARAAGVERMITIGAQMPKAAAIAEIAERYDDIFFTVGTHPHEAAKEGADFAAMRAFAKHPKCVGIGEAGLDYHYDYAPRDVARRVFRGQIKLARELDLLGVPQDARTFAAVDAGEGNARLDAPHRLEPGRALPQPQPVFPRYVEAEAAK